MTSTQQSDDPRVKKFNEEIKALIQGVFEGFSGGADPIDEITRYGTSVMMDC